MTAPAEKRALLHALLDDLAAESADLDERVAGLDEAVWSTPTQRGRAGHQQRGAGPVDRVVLPLQAQVQGRLHDHHRQQADRHADDEHQRQEALSTRQPPSSGPPIVATPKADPIRPW
ncbi:MAG: hypothetical protein Q8R60_16390 [Mycobacteriales bacterium]|nr:hypothetical protein [Mycobacteriales bacterium]